MTHTLQMIIGLSNPGSTYTDTRHNAGAWFVEHLADIARTDLKVDSKLKAAHGKITLENQDIRIAIPTGYMNHSGESVQNLVHFFKIPPESILICHDDLDLEVGTIRIKTHGGHGGHNGLRDIHTRLGTDIYNRLRIGIGRPNKATHPVIDYVLSKPSIAERQQIDSAILAASAVLPLMAQGHWQKAMSQLHTASDTPITKKSKSQ